MATHLTIGNCADFACGISEGESAAEQYTPGFCPECEQRYDAWKAGLPPAVDRAPQNAWLAAAATAAADRRSGGTLSTDQLLAWRRE